MEKPTSSYASQHPDTALFVAWRGLEPLCPTVLKLVTMHAPGMTVQNICSH
jgi:hypothetical protein